MLKNNITVEEVFLLLFAGNNISEIKLKNKDVTKIKSLNKDFTMLEQALLPNTSYEGLVNSEIRIANIPIETLNELYTETTPTLYRLMQKTFKKIEDESLNFKNSISTSRNLGKIDANQLEERRKDYERMKRMMQLTKTCIQNKILNTIKNSMEGGNELDFKKNMEDMFLNFIKAGLTLKDLQNLLKELTSIELRINSAIGEVIFKEEGMQHPNLFDNIGIAIKIIENLDTSVRMQIREIKYVDEIKESQVKEMCISIEAKVRKKEIKDNVKKIIKAAREYDNGNYVADILCINSVQLDILSKNLAQIDIEESKTWLEKILQSLENALRSLKRFVLKVLNRLGIKRDITIRKDINNNDIDSDINENQEDTVLISSAQSVQLEKIGNGGDNKNISI